MRFIVCFEKEKRLKIFKREKHLLWRKAKRRGFWVFTKTLKRLGQINQIKIVLLTYIKSHATEKFNKESFIDRKLSPEV